MTPPEPKRVRRFLLLIGLAAVGVGLFLPFLEADAPAPFTGGIRAAIGLGAMAIAAPATWWGLSWADRAGLPMPLLRAFENRTAAPSWRTLGTWGIAAGVGFGFAGLAVLRLAHLPASSASLPVRIGSAVFAAVTLESVLHLAIMSGVVLATGSRRIGIAAATVAYIGFHLSTLGGQPAVIAIATIGNGLGGLLFGWLYARFGYECLMLAHLVAHAVAVGLA